MQPPQGLVEKVKGLGKLKRLADSMPKTVRSGALPGGRARADLDLLPIQHCWPGDPAPFITLPAVITKDPRTGGRNVGMYRMQKIDARTTFMHWQIHKDGARRLARQRAGSTSRSRSGSTRSRPTRRARRSRSTSTSSCSPASCAASAVELVEGEDGRPRGAGAAPRSSSRATSRRASSGIEGPFGDHTGYYSPQEPFPIFHLTRDDDAPRRRSTRRSWSAYRPPRTPGSGRRPSGSSCRPSAMTVPEIVDYDLPVAGRLPQLRDRLDPQGVSRARAARSCTRSGASGCSASRSRSSSSTSSSTCTTTSRSSSTSAPTSIPKRDVVLARGPARPARPRRRRRTATAASSGSTRRTSCESEGARAWPERIEMSAEVRDTRRPPLGGVRDRASGPRKRAGFPRYCADRYVVDRSVAATIECRTLVRCERRATRGAAWPRARAAGGTARARGRRGAHLPAPTIWPFAFAAGVALLLVGLSSSTGSSSASAIAHRHRLRLPLGPRGRRASVRGAPEPVEEPAAGRGRARREEEGEEAGALRALRSSSSARRSASARSSAPSSRCRSLGFAVAPAFVGQRTTDVDLGPLDNFPEGTVADRHVPSSRASDGTSVEAHGVRPQQRPQGRRRRASRSSRTAASTSAARRSRTGPPGEPQRDRDDAGTVDADTDAAVPSFGCPCHGGAYDVEGNRIAGPPVRALDRYEFSIIDGNLVLGQPLQRRRGRRARAPTR